MAPRTSTALCLPDFLASWPYGRRVNPHYVKVSKAASAWISSYGLLTPKLQRIFELGNSAHLRVVCDALNIVLLFDDYSDTQSPQIVREISDNILDSLYDPYSPLNPRLEDLGRFGEITRSFWSRALQTLSPSSARRFTSAFSEYSDSIVQQAHDRLHEHIRDIDSYLALRRYTIGAKLAFALLDGEDDAMNEPKIVELENAAIDIISLSNDAYSFDIEQSRDDDAHNMLTCIMRSENVSLQEAMSLLQAHISTLAAQFLAIRAQVWEASHSDPVDASLLAYIDGIGNWVRANDAWSFESQRYFGDKGLEIQERRVIELRPKRASS
ncbi:terpenoid synthase [Gautieria morchelliformis]|nr:terpenoid synthase [Gautieria morchelliformis]